MKKMIITAFIGLLAFNAYGKEIYGDGPWVIKYGSNTVVKGSTPQAACNKGMSVLNSIDPIFFSANVWDEYLNGDKITSDKVRGCFLYDNPDNLPRGRYEFIEFIPNYQ